MKSTSEQFQSSLLCSITDPGRTDVRTVPETECDVQRRVAREAGGADRPLRPIRETIDSMLKETSPRFGRLYSDVGCLSIPPIFVLTKPASIGWIACSRSITRSAIVRGACGPEEEHPVGPRFFYKLTGPGLVLLACQAPSILVTSREFLASSQAACARAGSGVPDAPPRASVFGEYVTERLNKPMVRLHHVVEFALTVQIPVPERSDPDPMFQVCHQQVDRPVLGVVSKADRFLTHDRPESLAKDLRVS